MTSLITTSEPLPTHFRGALLRPAKRATSRPGATWNGAIDRRPALIARCAGADDVQRALGFARERDCRSTVRGGGHSVIGHAVADGAVMIDLSLMKGRPSTRRRGSPARPAACCGPSSTARPSATGSPPPAGPVSHVGIGGLTLGGGFGPPDAPATG